VPLGLLHHPLKDRLDHRVDHVGCQLGVLTDALLLFNQGQLQGRLLTHILVNRLLKLHVGGILRVHR
jgi:hypothetical protein